MRVLVAVAGCLLIGLVLVDVFNTIVLARRTGNSFRITRAFYILTWRPFTALAKQIRSSSGREGFLGIYGPLSLLMVFSAWVVALVLAFAGLQWSAGIHPADMPGTAGNALFLSATTLFTLETGDPRNSLSRFISVVEGGLGFCLLGLVIGYLPVFYQAFSRRELQISLLDARSGSPPSAVELLQADVSSPERVERYLERWEQWAAEILENQLSFPMMAWFRSHHANQSWLTALTAMIDCSAVISLCAEGDLKTQAEFTFAMGRHAVVDIASILRVHPHPNADERLGALDFAELKRTLERTSIPLRPERLVEKNLAEKRRLYEPCAAALGHYLMMALPDWRRHDDVRENWKDPGKPTREVPYSVSDPYSPKSHG